MNSADQTLSAPYVPSSVTARSARAGPARLLGVLIVITIAIIVSYATMRAWQRCAHAHARTAVGGELTDVDHRRTIAQKTLGMARWPTPVRCQGAAEPGWPLYTTEDVDPLITGQLYAAADYQRELYGERTAYEGANTADGELDGRADGGLEGYDATGGGMARFNSSGSSGDPGVDVGPYGLPGYGVDVAPRDDGIPAQWALPSTPIRWYKPAAADYYGEEGATVYADGLYNLTVPDHEPLV
jgi:hypothetical protein